MLRGDVERRGATDGSADFGHPRHRNSLGIVLTSNAKKVEERRIWTCETRDGGFDSQTRLLNSRQLV